MTLHRGFLIENAYWQSHRIRDLKPAHRNILVELFSILAENDKNILWGYLVDAKGQPMMESHVRKYIGGSNILHLRTWRAAKEELIARGIMKPVTMRNQNYYFFPDFVRMNPFKERAVTKTESGLDQSATKADRARSMNAECFLGFNPGENKPDDELDEWGRICKTWVELTTDETKLPRPIFSLDMPLKAKEAVKADVLAIVAQNGVENIIHDMKIAHDFKVNSGGTITTIIYFLQRWKSQDWMMRNRPVRKKVDKDNPVKERVKEEIKYQIEKGRVQSYADIKEEFPLVKESILKEIARELDIK